MNWEQTANTVKSDMFSLPVLTFSIGFRVPRRSLPSWWLTHGAGIYPDSFKAITLIFFREIQRLIEQLNLRCSEVPYLNVELISKQQCYS